ncbi:hypothetical protein BH10CYA1_BH10CYA1_48100 [soil metagenome]
MLLANTRVVLAGHGSRDGQGVLEFEEMVGVFRREFVDARVKHGYLEFAKPTVEEAVIDSIGTGDGPIIVVPALLAAATHAKNDMPAQLQALRKQFPEEDIRFASAMDLHSLLFKLCQQRIVECESTSPSIVSRQETCLVVVGRGTTDPVANGDIAKLTRMLQEGMSFGNSLVCYSGTAKPLVADALRQAAANSETRRLIVLPYFLFDGVLVKRIYAAADQIKLRAPQIEVLKSGYLGPNKYVAQVFADRAIEALEGRQQMDCSLCKYRTPIVGYESEVGSPQKPHAQAQIQGETKERITKYVPHPIEAQSFEIISNLYDWSKVKTEHHSILKRLVHTSGDLVCIDETFFSPGVVEIGIRAILRCRTVVTDVTMVQSGLKRLLIERLGVRTWCGVHDPETEMLAKAEAITRSAAGIRRAWLKFGNDVIVAIGDAPTAVAETVRLIEECRWRPQLVIGLPVGFVGTVEAKQQLKECLTVPRITNSGTRGGSPWAAATVNALLIDTCNRMAEL